MKEYRIDGIEPTPSFCQIGRSINHNVACGSGSHGQNLVKMVERTPSGAPYPPDLVQRTSPIGRKRSGVDRGRSGKTGFLPP